MLNASIQSIMLAPSPGSEGSGVTATANATGTGTLFYEWTVEQGSTQVAVGFTPTFNFVPPDNGNYDVNLRLTDSVQSRDTATEPLTVNNVDPTALLSNDGPVNEGSTATVTFSGQVDPSTADTSAGFRYAYDFNNDGTWDTGDGTYAGSITSDSQIVAASYLDDGPGTYTIKARILDKDDGYTDYTTDVTVNNVDPQLTDIEGTTIQENAVATVKATIVDPGVVDVFSVDVDWLDGSTATITGLGLTDASGTVGDTSFVWTAATHRLELSHQYLDDGFSPGNGTASDDYNVQLVVHDDDLGTSGPYLARVTVENVAPVLTPFGSSMSRSEGQLLDLSGAGGAASLATFTDDGTLDVHLAQIDWGDGHVEAGTVIESGGSGLVGGSHTYADDGDYTVTVRLADDDMSADFAAGTDGIDFVEQTFVVHVNNVDPTLTEVTPSATTLVEGDQLTLDAVFRDPGFDNPDNPNAPVPPSIVDTLHESFTYDINWGDGRDAILGMAVAGDDGGPGVDSSGSFSGSHTYADDGDYSVTVTVHDDNGGSNTRVFIVHVTNENPTLTGADGLVVDEGQAFTLDDLGVSLEDPGFDNSLNPTTPPAPGDPLQETFTGVTIDWGDGSALIPVSIDNVNDRVSGSPGVMTKATFTHAEHVYADNGDYVVKLVFGDDNGGPRSYTFTIHVENVAPSLTLTNETFAIDEGSTLDIANLRTLGTFTDPGFNGYNGSHESFTYTINWGDGTPVETGQLPASVADGGPHVLTSGTLTDSHFYADNDADNTYTITVTLSDDDGGSDVQTLDVTVYNVNPTLEPVSATDVESSGRTTLDLTFSDPGADEFRVMVDWGDKLNLPADQRFVVATVHAGPTPQSFTLEHYYAGPPDPLHPTADITITVKVFDDDVDTPGVMDVGISNLRSVTISNPGIEEHKVAIDTTPDVPRLEFSQPVTLETARPEVTGATFALQTPDVRVARGEVGVTSERYLELRVVHPDGTLSNGYRLKDKALNDLRGLFASLPDNRYVIYVVRTENNSRRIVIEVDVRRGRPIDTADDSEGTRDRPPTSETQTDNSTAQPLENHPLLDAVPDGPADNTTGQQASPPPAEDTSFHDAGADTTGATADASSDVDSGAPSPADGRVTSGRPLHWTAPLAGLALAAGDRWSSQVDGAIEHADRRAWQRLRRAGRLGRMLNPRGER